MTRPPGVRARRAAPLVLAGLLLLGCQAAPAATKQESAVPLEGPALAGRQLFVPKGCGACHKAPGVPDAQGSMGPDLRGIGSRPKIAAVLDNTPENMVRWLQDPQKVKPGAAMPTLGLSQPEATNLAAFLETLK